MTLSYSFFLSSTVIKIGCFDLRVKLQAQPSYNLVRIVGSAGTMEPIRRERERERERERGGMCAKSYGKIVS